MVTAFQLGAPEVDWLMHNYSAELHTNPSGVDDWLADYAQRKGAEKTGIGSPGPGLSGVVNAASGQSVGNAIFPGVGDKFEQSAENTGQAAQDLIGNNAAGRIANSAVTQVFNPFNLLMNIGESGESATKFGLSVAGSAIGAEADRQAGTGNLFTLLGGVSAPEAPTIMSYLSDSSRYERGLTAGIQTHNPTPGADIIEHGQFDNSSAYDTAVRTAQSRDPGWGITASDRAAANERAMAVVDGRTPVDIPPPPINTGTFDATAARNYLATGNTSTPAFSQQSISAPNVRIAKNSRLNNPIYDGDILTLAASSLLRNAIESTEPGRAAPEIHFDTRTHTLTVIDAGAGMHPSVLAGAFLQPDPAGEKGLDKLAYFSAANSTHVKTTSIDPRTGEYVTTTLRGGGLYDMQHSGAEIREESRAPDGRTGTTVSLRFHPDDTRMDINSLREWYSAAATRSMNGTAEMPYLRVDGEYHNPGDSAAPLPTGYQHISTIGTAGSSYDLHTSNDTVMSGRMTVYFLDRGHMKYAHSIKLANFDIPHPSEIVLNITPTVPTSSPDHPFRGTTVSPNFGSELSSGLYSLFFREGADAIKDVVRTAIDTAPRTTAGHGVVDSTLQFPPGYVRSVAQKPYLAHLGSAMEVALDMWYDRFKQSFPDATPTLFTGWSLNPTEYGSHIYSDVIRPLDRTAPDATIFNIYQLVGQALHAQKLFNGDDTWFKRKLASEIAETIEHEVTHAAFQNHDKNFNSAMSDMMEWYESTHEAIYRSILTVLNRTDVAAIAKDYHDEYVPQVEALGNPEYSILTSQFSDGGSPLGDQPARLAVYHNDASIATRFRQRLESRLQGSSPDDQSRAPQGRMAGVKGTNGTGQQLVSHWPPERTNPSISSDLSGTLSDAALNTHALTGSFPPGDPAAIATYTGGSGGVRFGHDALRDFVHLLDDPRLLGHDAGAISSQSTVTDHNHPERRPTGYLDKGALTKEMIPGTAPLAKVNYTNPKGKVVKRFLQVDTTRASATQLADLAMEAMDKYNGSVANYKELVIKNVKDLKEKYLGNKAAQTAYSKLPRVALSSLLEYDTFGDMHPHTLSLLKTAWPDVAHALPTEPLYDYLPPILQPYFNEVKDWQQAVEGRDIFELGQAGNPNASSMRLLDEQQLGFHYIQGLMVKKVRAGSSRYIQPGTRQSFQKSRSRLIEDPATGLLRETKGQKEFLAGRPTSVTESQLILGNDLATDDIATLMAHRDTQGFQRIQGEHLLNTMKNRGLAVRVFGKDNDSIAERVEEHQARIVNGQNQPLEPGWKVPSIAGFDMHAVPGSQIQSGYAVPNAAAELLENAFKTNFGGPLDTAIKHGADLTSQTKLILWLGTGFQHLNVLNRGVAVHTGLSLLDPRMVWHQPLELLKGYLELSAGNTAAQFWGPYREHLAEQWVKDPDLAGVQQHGGLGPQSTDLVKNLIGSDLKNMYEMPFIGWLERAPIGPVRVPFHLLNEVSRLLGEGLFDGVYLQTIGRAQKDSVASLRLVHPDWADHQIYHAAALFTNKLFGTMPAYHAVVRSESHRNLIKLVLLTMNEVESAGVLPILAAGHALNAVEGGTGPVGRAVRRGRQGVAGALTAGVSKATGGRVNPDIGMATSTKASGNLYLRSMIAWGLVGLTLAEVVQLSTSGQGLSQEQISPVRFRKGGGLFGSNLPQSNPTFFRPIIGQTQFGQGVYLDIVGQYDTLFRTALNPDSAAQNRFTPPMRAALELFTKHTYSGAPVSTTSMSENWEKSILQKMQSIGLDVAVPISGSSIKQADDNKMPTWMRPFEIAGMNIHPQSLKEVRDNAAIEAAGVSYSELLAHPGQVAASGTKANTQYAKIARDINSADNIKALVQRANDHFAQQGDTYNTSRQSAKDVINTRTQKAESFYSSGGYLKNPKAQSLPDMWSDIGKDAASRAEQLATDYAKTTANFNVTQVSQDLDKYYGILKNSGDPADGDPTINWPDTLAARADFLSSLPADRKADAQAILDQIAENKTPLHKAFTSDMQTLHDDGYPFGTRATKNFQEHNPNADIIMWKWFGSPLNTITAVDKAITAQADKENPVKMPIHYANATHRIDTDLPNWKADEGVVKWYEGLDPKVRATAINKNPEVNSTIIYWGMGNQFHSTAAKEDFDSYMGQNWKDGWQGETRDDVLYWLSLPGTSKNGFSKEKVLSNPDYAYIEADWRIFQQHQYGVAPVFTTTAAREEYRKKTGDSTQYPLTPPGTADTEDKP